MSAWEIVRSIGWAAEPFAESSAEWNRVLALSGYAPAAYGRAMVNYQTSYIRQNQSLCLDISMLIRHDGKPAAVWPLVLKKTGPEWELGSNEGPVLPPLFVSGLGVKLSKKLMADALLLIDSLCRQYAIRQWCGVESFSGSCCASPWHRLLMERGAAASLAHELFVDLSLEPDAIHANIRKSYKSLVSVGRRLWQVAVLDSAREGVFKEFMMLHKHAAGRVTRAPETWLEQEKAVAEGAAFLVYLRDGHGKMVGGGLFYTTLHEGVYAVGAYDRSLFDKPLGHVVQMHAIREMQKKGIRWYKIGERFYPGDSRAPTEKELNIAYFKEGFSTHTFFKIHTKSPIKPLSTAISEGAQ